MKSFMIKTGNLFFKWRDPSFTLIFLISLFIIALLPQFGLGMTYFKEHKMTIEIGASIIGVLFLISGQFARAITIGLAYIKRGGLNKKIYADELVQKGMFAHSRNPLYLGNLLILTGVIFSVNIHIYYLIVLPFFYFIYASITLAEEVFLRQKFKEKYDQYCLDVPNRYWPGNLSRWSESTTGMDFTWKRLIKKEHGSFVVMFASIAIVNLLKFHFRHGMAWDALFAQILYGFLIVLLIFQIISAYLKRTSRLEWDPNRP